MKIISNSDGYNPVSLVRATIKVISYSEHLKRDEKEKFIQELNRIN